jgi:hypothetical protein
VTRPISVRIDEVVLNGVEEGARAQLVQAEVARVLGRQAQTALNGRGEKVAAEVGRAVEASVRP